MDIVTVISFAVIYAGFLAFVTICFYGFIYLFAYFIENFGWMRDNTWQWIKEKARWIRNLFRPKEERNVYSVTATETIYNPLDNSFETVLVMR